MWRGAVLLSPLLALACGADPQPPAPFETPDIVLVSIDSLRPDHLSSYGYRRATSPFIDRLAGEGVRFENAVSSTSWTLPAHAGLFTGLYDSAHGLVTDGLRLSEAHRTLAETLRDAGFHTAGFYSGPYLHPGFGLGQGFDVYESCMPDMSDVDEKTARSWAAGKLRIPSRVSGPLVARAVGAWLEGLDDARFADRPVFLFLHLFDVHFDYAPPHRYIELFDPDYEGSIRVDRYMRNPAIHRDMDLRDLEHVVARYDGEIRLTDDVLREIISLFSHRRTIRNTIVVVTADHGEEFFEHGQKGHRHSLFEESVRVPLILRWPDGLDGGLSVPDQVRLIDVMPTLLSLARVAPPSGIQGRDLSPLLRNGRLEAEAALLELHSRTASLRVLRSNDIKLFWQQGRYLYADLNADPRERRVRLVEDGALQPMRMKLAELAERSRRRREAMEDGGTEPSAPNSATEERLRALGYIE